VLPGASPDLAAALAALGPALPREGQLAVALPGGAQAAFHAAETRFGPVVTVTAGNRFRLADDLGTYFSTYALQLVPMFGPALLVAVLAMPFVIHRALRPMRAAARVAETIDLHSLDTRIEARAPAELRPFLDAINRLLGRLEDGVRRQRIFTANAAHELRTPVAILQARLDALPEDAPSRADLARDVRRITLLLDQLLAVARLDQRETPLDEVVDLAALARGVAAEMAPLAIRAGRAVAVDVAGQPGAVRGNARALESALANLLENALRAEPPGGCVVVEAGPGGRLAVIDHGAGIAAADLPFLFEPFWRKDDGSRGTGLGLAIVSEVARLHAGSAGVEETPGGGATFVLAFPAIVQRQPAASEA
jgi:signal transduction histidine kinase